MPATTLRCVISALRQESAATSRSCARLETGVLLILAHEFTPTPVSAATMAALVLGSSSPMQTSSQLPMRMPGDVRAAA